MSTRIGRRYQTTKASSTKMEAKGLQEMIKLLIEDRRKQKEEIAAERRHWEELSVERTRKEEELTAERSRREEEREDGEWKVQMQEIRTKIDEDCWSH